MDGSRTGARGPGDPDLELPVSRDPVQRAGLWCRDRCLELRARAGRVGRLEGAPCAAEGHTVGEIAVREHVVRALSPAAPAVFGEEA